MDVPKYSATIVIGGVNQTTLFAALPKPTRSSTNGIITRQSGELELTFNNADGSPFDASGLTGSDCKVAPFNTNVAPVVLGAGIISGDNNEIYTVTWPKDTIPSDWSLFEQDADGSIVMWIEL